MDIFTHILCTPVSECFSTLDIWKWNQSAWVGYGHHQVSLLGFKKELLPIYTHAERNSSFCVPISLIKFEAIRLINFHHLLGNELFT